jgi:hypothetical protein
MILTTKSRIIIASITLIAWCCVGCMSTNPEKFTRQVKEWVPIGTPAAEAQRTMEHHGFECQLLTKDHPFNKYGMDYLDCDQEQVRLHDWHVQFFVEDGKVSKYGPMGVDDKTW